jgi:hypothetical protein
MRDELHRAYTTRERKEKCVRILVENPEEMPAWKDLDIGRSKKGKDIPVTGHGGL